MVKRTFALLICVCVLFSCCGCAGKESSGATHSGLTKFAQALTTAGYQTTLSTTPEGTTIVELIPPTAVPTAPITIPIDRPTTSVLAETAQTTMRITTDAIVTAPKQTTAVFPGMDPEIVTSQPTVPTTAKTTQTNETTTSPKVTTTAAPTASYTTAAIPEATVVQPTVPTTTMAVITVPATTVQRDTTPVITAPQTIPPVTTVPAITTQPQTPVYGDTGYQTQTMVHYTSRYFYSTLNELQKQWYQKIDTAVRNLEDRVLLGPGLGDNENYYIYYLYMMDNPEHFYLINRIGIFDSYEGQGLILGYSDGNLVSGIGLGNATQELRNSIRAKQFSFNARVSEIIGTVPSHLPDVEKERLLYDSIILSASYNQQAQWNDYAEDNWTAYGVLIDGKGVCESYSEAFQLLCYTVGINCTGVVGGDHKWNAVCLDGEWYMCDVTWDDPVGGDPFVPYHKYFNLTTQQILHDHEIDDSRFQVPECTATKYSYQNYFGQ